MKESLSEILVLSFKKLIPLFLTLFCVLVLFVPSHIPLSHFFRPDLAMACLYFWVLYRSDLFSVFCVVVLGVVSDSLSGTPFGLNLLVFVFAYILTLTYGSYVNTKPFFISWVGFALVFFLSLFLKWILLSIYHKMFLPVPHILLTYAATVLIYPLMAQINIFVQNKYLRFEGEINEQG